MKPVLVFIKNVQSSIWHLLKRAGLFFIYSKIISLIFICLCFFMSNLVIATSENTASQGSSQQPAVSRDTNTLAPAISAHALTKDSLTEIGVKNSLSNISATITLENFKSANLDHIASSSIEIKEHFLIPTPGGVGKITLSKFFDNPIITPDPKNLGQVFNASGGSAPGISGFKTAQAAGDLANIVNPNNSSAKGSLRPFDTRVAVVDVEAIFEHSIAIKDIRHKINKISNQIQKEMSQRELDLKKFEEEIIKQRGLISEVEFNDKLVEFHRRVSSAQQLLQKRRIALDRAHNEAISAVHKNSIEIIAVLAAKHGFNLVIPTAQVVYVAGDLNITMEVISELNKKLTHIEIHYDNGG